jgi:hypothetical protein
MEFRVIKPDGVDQCQGAATVDIVGAGILDVSWNP